MNNIYELKIHLNYRPDNRLSVEDVHYHLECDELSLKENLYKITSNGILLDIGDTRRFIPGHEISFIDVEAIERVQNVHDVSESVKAALKEE